MCFEASDQIKEAASSLNLNLTRMKWGKTKQNKKKTQQYK